MRNISTDSVQTCFVIKRALYDFIVVTSLGYDIWEKYIAASGETFRTLTAQIYRAVADFFDVNEVTGIENSESDTKIVFFKDASVTEKLPTENFAAYHRHISAEQDACADTLVQTIVADAPATDTDAVRRAVTNLLVALCADKNDLGKINRWYDNDDGASTANRLRAVVNDIRERVIALISEHGIGVETKLVLDAAAEVMHAYDIETCQPYTVCRNPWEYPDDSLIPCYATGRCKNKHCPCPHT